MTTVRLLLSSSRRSSAGLCLALSVGLLGTACQEEARTPRNPTAAASPTAPPSTTTATTPGGTTPNGTTTIPGTSTGGTTPPAQAAGQKCTVQGVAGSYLNFRAGPSVTAEDIGDLTDGTEVDFVATAAGGWVKVRYNGQEGYACDTCNGDDNLNCEGASLNLNDAPPVRSKHPNPDGSFG